MYFNAQTSINSLFHYCMGVEVLLSFIIFQTSSTTTTTTMTTPAKLYGKDLSAYDDIDVEELLSQLTAEEISLLSKDADPDVSIFDRIPIQP